MKGQRASSLITSHCDYFNGLQNNHVQPTPIAKYFTLLPESSFKMQSEHIILLLKTVPSLKIKIIATVHCALTDCARPSAK